jgi:hypothetical protein
MTPCESIYGQNPLLVQSYVPRTSKVHGIDKTLHTRKNIICILMENLFMAQNQMKQQDTQHRYECSFNERD